MIKFKTMVAVATALFCVTAHAALTPAATDLNKLLTPINSLQAQFKQTIFTDRKKIIQEASGFMEFQRPKSFRWQVEQPDKSLIVTNGEKLWNYDPDLEQVTVRKFDANTEVSPVSFLFDDIAKLDSNFKIEYKTNKGHDYSCFKLTPKQENPSFVDVEVCFKSGQIVSLYLLDHLHQTSKFEFAHVQKNINISKDRFTFVPPHGVDVIGDT